jgi:ubiquinone biosynthesis monooxygenase Coq6
MSAVDKLHKIYSTTTQPFVWARSVGVEVLNESDTLKTAMMMTAGARTNQPVSNAWTAVGQGWETAANAIGIAKLLGGTLASTAARQLQGFAERARR